MTRSKWKLILDDDSDPQIEEWGDDSSRRFSGPMIPLLALLAANPHSGLVEIAPGVFEGPKAP